MAPSTFKKPYDRALPFTRVDSPSSTKSPPDGKVVRRKLDGDGHTRGTRHEDDFVVRSLLDLIRKRVTAIVPSWVPTLSADAGDEVLNDQELQGVLVKSFQTWTDTPVFQWHRWYDWNFHVIPDDEFDWLRGAGNGPGAATGTIDDGSSQFTVPGKVMELEWDTGCMSKAGIPESAGGRPGPMFIGGLQQKEWAWPMAGHRFWARGRSIYDGGHEGKDGPTKGKCRAELHPCRAIAWARYEAFKFKEHDKCTPAVQFMFFTSKFGTPIDHPDIKPKDGNPYVFIVDLPLAPADPHDADIADSEHVKMNTVFLRELELVKDFDRQRYNATLRADVPPAEVDPIVELLDLPKDFKGDRRQRQAQITIPLAALAGDAYGVLISLGWRDFSGMAAKRVKKCKVTLNQLTQHKLGATAEPNWRVKFGVNGRWFQFDFAGMDDKEQVRSFNGASAEIFLEVGDRLEFSAHGTVIRPVDVIFTGGEIRVPVLASIPVIGRLFRFHPTDGTDRSRTLFIGDRDIADEEAPDPNIAAKIIGNFVATPLDILSLFLDAIAGGQGPTGTLGRRPVVWTQDVDKRPPLPTDGPTISRMYPVQRAVLRRAVQMMADTWSLQNRALGIIDGRPIGILDSDPATKPSSFDQDAKFERSVIAERPPRDANGVPIGPGPGNPYVVCQQDVGKGPMKLTLTAYETWELGETAELVERPHAEAQFADKEEWKDYHLDLTIEVTEQ
jgi:hypothetical protein